MTMLRTIKYRRHEFRHKPRAYEGTLLTFIYDIPYFPACGVFPPPHVINQVFSRGGGDGGMSPGASWEPFTISEEEYLALKEAVAETPIVEIAPLARYAHARLKFDPEFDHIEDQLEWTTAVCEKHRESWHAELRAAGKLA